MDDKQIQETIEAIRSNTERVLAEGPEACRKYLREAGILTTDEPLSPDLHGNFRQPFEKFPELTHFIQQMASSGMVPHGSGWTSFLYELNEVCKVAFPVQAPHKTEGEGKEWTACADNLPHEGGRYWCYCEEINDLGISHFQWNCSYDPATRSFSDNLNTVRVTHWMPLASAPKTSAPSPVIPDKGSEIPEEDIRELLELVGPMAPGVALQVANYIDRQLSSANARIAELEARCKDLQEWHDSHI